MTAQVHENLIYNGVRMTMPCCPPLPEGNPRLIRISREEAMRRTPEHVVFSTACWREYVATWEIKDGRLYLAGISGIYRLLGEDPLFADWFTGSLQITKGKLLHYVHMGFESIYEQEIHMLIESGKVISTRIVDNRGKTLDEIHSPPAAPPGEGHRFITDDTDDFDQDMKDILG